jgi:hypothetical protein
MVFHLEEMDCNLKWQILPLSHQITRFPPISSVDSIFALCAFDDEIFAKRLKSKHIWRARCQSILAFLASRGRDACRRAAARVFVPAM